MSELISIIIPVYNVEKYLEKCVNSVLSQSYNNLEVILVNDGSTDNSLSICEKLSQTDKRIKVINQKNSGLSAARNRGISVASADIIGFIDSDDYIDFDFVELLYKNMINSGADISMCGLYDVYNNKPTPQVVNKCTYELNTEEAVKMVMGTDVISVAACIKLYRKELFTDIKFPVGKIAEDAFVMTELFHKCKKVIVTNEKKYYYVHRENSITTQKFTMKYLDVIEAYEYNYSFIEKNYPHLIELAKIRIIWSYFYVLDKLLVDKSFVDKSLEKRLISNLISNKRDILKSKVFTISRKISFICLTIHPIIYKELLKLKTK